MGRPSKLTPEQWDTLERRVALGETAASLAREYGISQTQISLRVTKVSKVLKETAERMAGAQEAVAALPPKQQAKVMALADHLRDMNRYMAEAGALGAQTAAHLQRLALGEALMVTRKGLAKHAETIKGVAILARTANEAIDTARVLAGKTVALPDDEIPADEPTEIRLVGFDED